MNMPYCSRQTWLVINTFTYYSGACILVVGFLEILADFPTLKCKLKSGFCQDTYLANSSKIGVGWDNSSLALGPGTGSKDCLS